jgi:hypothetical protein
MVRLLEERPADDGAADGGEGGLGVVWGHAGDQWVPALQWQSLRESSGISGQAVQAKT